MAKNHRLFSKPGYTVYLTFLCLTLFCLPFVSLDNFAENLGPVSLYLFLLWLFLILNLFLISRCHGHRPPSRDNDPESGP